MKRHKEREFVKIYPQHTTVRGQHRTQYVVCWTPEPNNRQRLTFSDPDEAENEADRKEEEMQFGLKALSKIPKHDLVQFNMLLMQIPGVPLSEIARTYLQVKGVNGFAAGKDTVQQVADAYMQSRNGHSEAHRKTLRTHFNRLTSMFGERRLSSMTPQELAHYLEHEIGGAGKSRLQHLITIRALFHFGRDKQKCLIAGMPTAADEVERPRVIRHEHEIYTPQELTRLLAFTPRNMLGFMVLGAFAGLRAAERLRLKWRHWRVKEDSKLVVEYGSSKNTHRRAVDVPPNLADWLDMLKGEPDEHICIVQNPYDMTAKIARTAKLPWKDNALRSGYVSYHSELFDNIVLTAKNSGHTIKEAEQTYRSLEGVTKKTAQETFEITPDKVTTFVQDYRLPMPDWGGKL